MRKRKQSLRKPGWKWLGFTKPIPVARPIGGFFNGVHMNQDTQLKQSPASILLVEDDASLAEWILQYLQGHNYQLRHIDRGDQVLASVKEQPPELIILDVMLPYKNGFDLCRELRAFYNG